MDLVADGITHAYERLTVLENVSLEARGGEIVVILGPSGCGKSTLLRILGGLERPELGRVFTRGAPAPRTLSPLAFVFQDFALVPWMTVEQNISLPLGHHPMSRSERDERIGKVLARVGLEDFRHAHPKQLSGGMRQRTGIARALVVEPAILLLDEPLSALDEHTRELLMEDLLRLQGEARLTAVYVTHNLSEAVRLGHRVIVMSRRPGKVRRELQIDIPLKERSEAMPELQRIRAELWDLVRGEAAASDRELVR